MTARAKAEPHTGPGDLGFAPQWITHVELADAPVDLVAPAGPDGEPFDGALLVVLLHDHPLGVVEVALDDGVVRADELVGAITHHLGDRVSAHLAADERTGAFGPEGGPDRWPCWPDRDAVLLPSASVVICSRDRPEELVGAIRRLLELDYPDYEIVVVDNAPSSEATADAVRAHFAAQPRVRYVREDAPGLAHARNAGLRVASGTIVAFTDDDIRVSNCWLRALARGFTRDPSVACVTGLVAPGVLETRSQLQFEQAVAYASRWGFEPRLFDLEEHRTEHPLHPYQAGLYGGGGNSAFDRAFLLGIGGFDPALGAGTPTAGGEDLDVFLRVVATGRALAYEPSALVWHLHGTDERRLRTQAFRYGLGLGAYLFKLACSPTHAPKVLARSPHAARYLLSGRSEKNAQKAADYPRLLTGLELAGVACGPAAYLRSRARNRLRYRRGPAHLLEQEHRTSVGRGLRE